MLDPRIYRTGLVVVALAVIVFAFSLDNQPGALTSTLAPDAFSGQNAYTTMNALARADPDRLPGSAGDEQVASAVAARLRALGYTVATQSFRARTAVGVRTLENVTAEVAGSSDSSIVVVAHRDALHAPAAADLSGTAVLLELARLLSGETPQHNLVLASTSGSIGAAGAAALARTVPGPIDAVIVLGDLAATRPQQPLIVPWSDEQVLAAPALTNTVAATVSAQAGLTALHSSLVGQLLHLAFPITLTEQAPFNDSGASAVLLSLAGEHSPAADEPTSEARIAGMGQAVLEAVNALDGSGNVPAPSSYLVLGGLMIPLWAVRLLVLAAIVPVALTVLDGLARLRRRRHPIVPWLGWVLACGLAFGLAAGVVALARVAGILSSAPAGPIPPGVAPPRGGDVATMALAGVAVLAGLALLPRLGALAGAARPRRRVPAEPGAGMALVLVLLVAAVVLWVRNPFAAVLLVPALHLWMWGAATELPLPRLVRLVLALLGAAAPAAAVLYYAMALRLSPVGVLWNGVLMVARGDLGGVSVAVWSAALGCFAAALVLAVKRRDGLEEEPVAITVRGPVTYAGPGSLGHTPPAVRR